MEQGEIILYQPDEAVKLEVRLEDETVWLTQEQIADLFGTKRPAITKHLNNIYKSGELDIDSTCSILEHMGNDGKQRYTTKYYNLDAILSIGYRVNSKNATLFRKWANSVLKDYLLKGYSINKRLSELERTVAQHTEKIDHDPLQLSQQPVYQQPCPVKACLVRELCQLVQIVRHSRQAAQQRILFITVFIIAVTVIRTHETKFSKCFFYLFFCQCNLHTRSFLPVEPIGQFLIFSISYYDVVCGSVISELNCILAQTYLFCNRKFSFL